MVALVESGNQCCGVHALVVGDSDPSGIPSCPAKSARNPRRAGAATIASTSASVVDTA
jgi:hypothetical protein